MDFFNDFMSNYGATILYTIMTAIGGYLGLFIKNMYSKYINDQTKKDVVNTCVRAVEQLYKDLHGDEKLQKAIEAISSMLNEKNISASTDEIRLLIEAAVLEFNKKVESVEVGLDK